MINPEELNNRASNRKKANAELFRKLKKRKPSDLDETMGELHKRAFSEIDCLECANCCKTISPFLIDKDIQRISRFLKLRPSDLVETYLVEDEEGDYVFRSSPCPFLQKDNYCSIYEARPRACREYPHTDRKRMVQILDLTLKNTFICPAVYEITEELHRKYF